MTGAQIMVVEDEGITATDLEARLTRLGYRVPAIAYSGAEALARAAETRPDLVLMDIKLQGNMDGVQVAAELRTRWGIAVTYLTAYADEATLARARETAPYGYLVKPFDERELHATIQTALRRRQLEQQVEQANRLKGDMIAIVSHELRGSLGTVGGLAELLLNGEFGSLTSEQATQLHSMEESLKQMLDLIRSTLEFGRTEQPQSLLDVRAIAPAELVAELAKEMTDFPRAPAVRLAWDVDPDVPVLSSDPVKLTITLRNLVTNALKNTEQGSVAVSVHRSGDGVEFRVNDTGTGIPPEALEVIFEPFRQLGTRGANRGVGLGLYITRRLADMLGGTISVDSTVGRGSTFRVWVPCRAAGATGGSGL